MSEQSRKSVISATSVVGLLRRRRITLTSAQILALFTTPIAILPAQGPNMYNEVVSITALLKFGSVAYTGANALEFRHTNASGAKVTGDIAAAFINASANRVDKAVDVAVTSVPVNSAVVVAVPTANPGAGDGTISLDIAYRTVSIA